MPFVADTHALVWYMTNDANLSSEARRIFQDTDDGKEEIHIPCIVFFELLYLVERKNLPIDLDGFLSMFRSSENYKVEPLCLPVIEKSRDVSAKMVSDPFDRLIAATSMHLNLPLITRDRALRKIGLRTIW
jgi:PIN domain nuclease of toxin-antitoxin system